MNKLDNKRIKAVRAIAAYAAGGATAAAAPTPGIEVQKQIVLTTSDILMYISIGRIYFEEDLAAKKLLAILAELGIVTIAATGTAYLVAKGSTAIAGEVTDWFGPIGWGVSALITSSLTGLFGAAWLLYCDRLYADSRIQPENL